MSNPFEETALTLGPWNGYPPYNMGNCSLDGLTLCCTSCGYPLHTLDLDEAVADAAGKCPHCGRRITREIGEGGME